MTEWYPVMLNLGGKSCVVFGGGQVAARKTAGLMQAGAQVRIVSPRVTAELREWAEARRLQWDEREGEEADVAGAALVFAATDRPEVNRRLADAARRLGIPVNVADDGTAGDFLVPAVLRRGRFVLTAGVSGAGPVLAARVIRELAARYGPEYADYAEALGYIRGIVKSRVENAEERRRLLAAAAKADALEEWRGAGLPAVDTDWLLERIRAHAAMDAQEEDIS